MLLSIKKSEFSYHVSMVGKLYKRCYSSIGWKPQLELKDGIRRIITEEFSL